MRFLRFGMNRPRGMVGETFHHAAIYSAATVLGRMVSFFMLPFYSHILRDIGYGVIGMIDTGLVLLSSLFGQRLQTAVTRIYHEQEDPERKAAVVASATSLVAMIILPLVVLGGLFSQPISNVLLGTGEYWNLVCMALATFYLNMVTQTANSVLIIQRRSKTFAAISLMRLFTGLSLNIVLVVILRWDLLGFFLSGLIVAVLSLVVALRIQHRICGFGFDRDLVRDLVRFQLPLVPTSLARFFSTQIERVLVRYQIDLATLGVLEMAYKFPILLNMLVIMPFNKSWGTKAFEIADQEGGDVHIGQMFSYFLYLTLLGGLILTVNIEIVLQLMTPPEFWPAAHVARIMALAIIMHGVGMHLGFGILYAKRTGILARVEIVLAVVKIGLSYSLISIWGFYGAAWSELVSTSTSTIVRHFIGQRYYRLPLETGKLMLIVGFAVAVYVGIEAIPQSTVVGWGAPFLEWSSNASRGLQDTWLGEWRSGRVLEAVLERRRLVFELAVRTLMVGSYLSILPLVHVETRRRLRRLLWQWVRTRRGQQ